MGASGSSEAVRHRSSLQRQASKEAPVPMLVITDPGQDLDDEMAMIMIRYLTEQGYVEVRGMVATLAPSFDRARLTRGTLDLLGLKDIPVAVGTDGGDMKGVHKASFEESAASYMPAPQSDASYKLHPARRLMYQILEDATPKSLTVVVIASLKDPALFLRDNESLFVSKVKEVVIMGGVTVTPEGEIPNPMTPDAAHNNEFDVEASKFFYRRCQELGVPLVILGRLAAYAAKMPRTVYDQLAVLGSSIGVRLRNAQRTSIETLWTRACGAPDDAAVRKGLPPRCDREWFLKTFCSGNAGVPPRGGNDSIWDLLDGFMQYDTLAVLAAVPQLRREYFTPTVVEGVGGAKHLVIGKSEEVHGVTDSDKLISLLKHGFAEGLAMNHHHRTQIIMLTNPRWDNRADEIMACLMLRVLYNLSLINCLGIIVAPAPPPPAPSEPTAPEGAVPKEEGEAAGRHGPRKSTLLPPKMDRGTIEDQAGEIAETLKLLGLPQIPVRVSSCGCGVGDGHAPVMAAAHACDDDEDSDDGADISSLVEMYRTAPPSGVTLVVTASVTEAAAFARKHPTVFREKTQRVVLMSGALIAAEQIKSEDGGEPEFTGRQVLAPDPAAQNNRLDMQAANELFTLAQELSVPLIILSRHLAHACSVPRQMFDALETHGGALGKKLAQVERESIQELWRCACAAPGEERRGLPLRCDRQWFVSMFCPHGPPTDDGNVWPAVESFSIYNPLALCAALPLVVERFLQATQLTVRSATHHVVGLSKEMPGVEKPDDVRALVYQCLFKGALINASEFDMQPPPSIPLDVGSAEGGDWNFDSSEEALAWLLPATISRTLNSCGS